MSDSNPIPSNLVSGSIWERQRKSGDPTSVLVICVTNTELSAERQESNPPQVVFVNETAKVLSMGVEMFVRSRTYLGLHDGFASSLGTAISAVLQEEPEVPVDLDAVVVDDALFTQEEGADEDDGDEADDSGMDSSGLSLNMGPHPSKEFLEHNFVAYGEAPFHTGDTLHTLQFLLDETVTMEMIQAAFTSSDPNSVQKFEVSTPTSTFQVEIDGVIGVMLQSNGAYDVGILNITTEGDFRAAINADEAQLLAEPQSLPSVGDVAVTPTTAVGTTEQAQASSPATVVVAKPAVPLQVVKQAPAQTAPVVTLS